MTSSDLDGDSHGVGGEGAAGGGGVGTRIGPGDALVAPICTPPPGTLFSTNTNTNTYNNNEIPATPPTLSSLLFDHLNNTLSSTLDLTLSLNNNNNNSSPYSSIPSPSSYLDLNQSLTSPSSSSFSSFFVSSSPSPSRLCRDGNCTTAEPPESTIIKPTIISPLLLSLTGITGHIWALCYLHGTSPRNASRTVFHTLLLALIWTDFLGKIATTVPAVTAYVVGSWVGGIPLCNYHGFSMVLVCLLTHFTVSAMAVERFLGICHGYFYGRHVTPSRCRYVLAGIWVFCSLFSLLPLFNLGQLFLQYPNTWCFANIHICHDTPARHRFFTTTLGLLTVANLLTIVICNVIVVGTLLRMRVSRRIPASFGQQSRGRSDHELQMVVVLVVITVVFTISWAPLDFLIVSNPAWPPHLDDKDHMIELMAIRLVSINQIVDPWAYIICRVAFRSRAWRWCRVGLVGRGWSHRWRNNEDGSLWSHHLSSLIQHTTRKLSRAQAVVPPPPPSQQPLQQHNHDDHNHTPSPHHQPLLQENADGEDVDCVVGGGDPYSLPLQHPSSSFYSDSGTGSYYGGVGGDGGGGGVARHHPHHHPCCLHSHLTRSQPLLPPPPTSPTSTLNILSTGNGVLRSNSWGALRPPRPPLHNQLFLLIPPSSPCHSRSTQTLPPCPSTPPPSPLQSQHHTSTTTTSPIHTHSPSTPPPSPPQSQPHTSTTTSPTHTHSPSTTTPPPYSFTTTSPPHTSATTSPTHTHSPSTTTTHTHISTTTSPTHTHSPTTTTTHTHTSTTTTPHTHTPPTTTPHTPSTTISPPHTPTTPTTPHHTPHKNSNQTLPPYPSTPPSPPLPHPHKTPTTTCPPHTYTPRIEAQ